jgi:hypothetical protein
MGKHILWVLATVATVSILLVVLIHRPSDDAFTRNGRLAAGSASSTIACVDTDGGEKTGAQGYTQTYEVRTDGSQIVLSSLTDSCANPWSVNEYSCQGNEVIASKLDCDAGDVCRNGACVPLQ